MMKILTSSFIRWFSVWLGTFLVVLLIRKILSAPAFDSFANVTSTLRDGGVGWIAAIMLVMAGYKIKASWTVLITSLLLALIVAACLTVFLAGNGFFK
jgi:hypothetical protein